MPKKDLYTIAKENGFTDEEFLEEVADFFAANTNAYMDRMGPETMCEFTFNYEEHTLKIQCRKYLKDKHTIN